MAPGAQPAFGSAAPRTHVVRWSPPRAAHITPQAACKARYAMVQSVMKSCEDRLQGAVAELVSAALLGGEHAEVLAGTPFLDRAVVYEVVYELHLVSGSLLLTLMPVITQQLRVEDAAERFAATKLLGDLFASKAAKLGVAHAVQFQEWCARCLDAEDEIRAYMCTAGAAVAIAHDELAERVCEHVGPRLQDSAVEARLAAAKAVADIATAKLSLVSAQLLSALGDRAADKRADVRREAITGLAQVFATAVTPLWEQHDDYSEQLPALLGTADIAAPLARSRADDMGAALVAAAGRTPEAVGTDVQCTRALRALEKLATTPAEVREIAAKLWWVPDVVLRSYAHTEPEVKQRVIQLLDRILLPERLSPLARARGAAQLYASMCMEARSAFALIVKERAALQRQLRAWLARVQHLRAGSSSAEAMAGLTSDAELLAASRSIVAGLPAGGVASTAQARAELWNELAAVKDRRIFLRVELLANPRARACDLADKRQDFLQRLGSKSAVSEVARALWRRAAMTTVSVDDVPALALLMGSSARAAQEHGFVCDGAGGGFVALAELCSTLATHCPELWQGVGGAQDSEDEAHRPAGALLCAAALARLASSAHPSTAAAGWMLLPVALPVLPGAAQARMRAAAQAACCGGMRGSARVAKLAAKFVASTATAAEQERTVQALLSCAALDKLLGKPELAATPADAALEGQLQSCARRAGAGPAAVAALAGLAGLAHGAPSLVQAQISRQRWNALRNAAVHALEDAPSALKAAVPDTADAGDCVAISPLSSQLDQEEEDKLVQRVSFQAAVAIQAARVFVNLARGLLEEEPAAGVPAAQRAMEVLMAAQRAAMGSERGGWAPADAEAVRVGTARSLVKLLAGHSKGLSVAGGFGTQAAVLQALARAQGADTSPAVRMSTLNITLKAARKGRWPAPLLCLLAIAGADAVREVRDAARAGLRVILPLYRAQFKAAKVRAAAAGQAVGAAAPRLMPEYALVTLVWALAHLPSMPPASAWQDVADGPALTEAFRFQVSAFSVLLQEVMEGAAGQHSITPVLLALLQRIRECVDATRPNATHTAVLAAVAQQLVQSRIKRDHELVPYTGPLALPNTLFVPAASQGEGQGSAAAAAADNVSRRLQSPGRAGTKLRASSPGALSGGRGSQHSKASPARVPPALRGATSSPAVASTAQAGAARAISNSPGAKRALAGHKRARGAAVS